MRPAHRAFRILLCFICLAATMQAADDPACSRKTQQLHRHHAASSVGDPAIDVTFYRLALTVDIGGSIRGTVDLHARITAPTAIVSLDLSGSMTLDSVRLNGTLLPVLRYPSSFLVQLPRTYQPGEQILLILAYHGIPQSTGFGSFAFATAPTGPWIWTLSQPYGARDWWPCKDHQLDKADSVDILVTVPAGLKVGSNGLLESVITNADGTATHVWKTRYPIATYLVSIAVAPYVEFTNWYRHSPGDSLAILNYVLPHRVNEALQTLPKTVDMMEIFSRLYGPYPFLNEKYGHSEFGRGGAMEHQTMTSTTTFDEDVIAHELAHQWFGNLITCRTWQDLWLNEGFATYSESLYREARYGLSEYQRLIRSRMSRALGAQGTLFVRDTSSVANLFAANRVYSKGASVLHMLRHVLGDSSFFAALRAYAGDKRFRYGTANTADFQQVCESVWGRSLEFFFRQWIYGERYPRYTFSWTASAEGGSFLVDARIRQETGTTNPPAFEMPVDLRCTAGTWDTTVVVWNGAADQSFQFLLPFRPEQITLDPDQWILKEVLDPNPLLPDRVELNQNYPNPFNAGTIIPYRLPRRTAVRLDVLDPLGRRVVTLVDGVGEAGAWSAPWNATDGNGAPVASGVYYYRLTTDGSVSTLGMVYIR